MPQVEGPSSVIRLGKLIKQHTIRWSNVVEIDKLFYFDRHENKDNTMRETRFNLDNECKTNRWSRIRTGWKATV